MSRRTHRLSDDSRRRSGSATASRALASAAAHYVIEALESRCLLSVGGIPDWVEQGPGPMREPVYGFEAVGAMDTIAIHPGDGNIMYAGSVNGGVWKTTNALSSFPTWVPLTDQFRGTSISDIAFDPLDSSGNTLWAANGGYSNLGRMHTPLRGLLKTTDGGMHWTEAGVSTFSGQSIRTVLPTATVTGTGQRIFVAADNGLYRSDNGGASFAPISGSDGLPVGKCTAIVNDPSTWQLLYAAIPGQGVYRNDTSGSGNWTTINSGLTSYLPGSIRILLDTHYTPGNRVVYAAIIGSNGGLLGVFRTPSFGTYWDKLGTAPNMGYQGTTDASLVADPSNANTVFVALVDGPYRWNNSLGIWEARFDPSTTSVQHPHCDSRDMEFDLYGRIIELDDGGIYRLSNPSSSSWSWSPINGSLRTTEITAVSYDWINNVLFSTQQDNGGAEQYALGNQLWRSIYGGDGYATSFEGAWPYAYRYSMGNNYKITFCRKFDSSGNLIDNHGVMLASAATPSVQYSGLNAHDQTWNPATPGQFPIAANRFGGARMVIGGDYGLYESNNRGDIITEITPSTPSPGIRRSIIYGGRSGGVDNADLIYFAETIYPAQTTPRLWLRSSAAGGFTQLTAYPGANVRALVADPDDWHILYIADASGHIWRTTNAGAAGSWTEITANLGDYAPSGLGTLDIYKSGSATVLLGGGDGGVYRWRSTTSTWTKFGHGLSQATVSSLHYDPNDDLLIAGAIGRSVWTLPQASQFLYYESSLMIEGGEFSENDVIRLAQDTYNPLLLDVYVNNSGTVPTYQVQIAAVQKVQMFSYGGDDTILVENLPAGMSLTIDAGTGNDFIDIASSNYDLNNIRSSVTVTGGSGTDTLRINDDYHGSGETYLVYGSAVTRTGVFGGLIYSDAETVRLYGPNYSSSFYLWGTPSGSTLELYGRTGATIYVGSPGLGTQNLLGPVVLLNPPAYNTVIVNDAADTVARNVTHTTYSSGGAVYGSIIGLAPATIDYKEADTNSPVSITGGSGGNTWNINATTIRSISLDPGAGTDTLNINETNPTGPVTVLPSGGFDAVSVNTDSTGAATAWFNSSIDLGSLSIGSGGSSLLASGGNKVLFTRSLSVAGTGRLDLTDEDMIVDYTSRSVIGTIGSLLASGHAAGAWNGSGINTSLGYVGTYALGYAEASDVAPGGSFSGHGVDGTAVCVKYTYYGDASLDGRVDISDLGRLATNWQLTGMRWAAGNFNYDSIVDISDLGSLATNWQCGVGNPLHPTPFNGVLNEPLTALQPSRRVAMRLLPDQDWESLLLA